MIEWVPPAFGGDNVHRLINGFPDSPFQDAAIGVRNFLYDTVAGAWNLSTTISGNSLVSKQFQVETIGCGSRIQCQWYAGAFGASVLGGGATTAPFRGASSVTIFSGTDVALTSGPRALAAASNEAIISRAATVGADGVVAPNARVAGTLSHSRAARFIDKYQGIFGDRGLRNNFYVRGPNGRLGSSTFDVLDTSTIVIYDFKFGQNAVTKTSQFNKYTVARPGAQIKIVDRFGNITNR